MITPNIIISGQVDFQVAAELIEYTPQQVLFHLCCFRGIGRVGIQSHSQPDQQAHTCNPQKYQPAFGKDPDHNR